MDVPQRLAKPWLGGMQWKKLPVRSVLSPRSFPHGRYLGWPEVGAAAMQLGKPGRGQLFPTACKMQGGILFFYFFSLGSKQLSTLCPQFAGNWVPLQPHPGSILTPPNHSGQTLPNALRSLAGFTPMKFPQNPWWADHPLSPLCAPMGTGGSPARPSWLRPGSALI